MGILSKWTNVSTLSIAANTGGCLAHGLPTSPDWAVYQPLLTNGGLIGLVTRGAAALYFHNAGGNDVPGEAISQYVFSVNR